MVCFGYLKCSNLKLEKAATKIYFVILGTARSELNRLFNFAPSIVQSNSERRNERKRKHQTTLKLPNTWTHIFVCLGKTIDLETPNQAYKKQLQSAGLGEKKLFSKKNSSCSYFHDTLLENYPRLRDGGGYELLCTKHRSTTQLEILNPRQTAGYNVFHLKEDIASAKVYVKPLQWDLNLNPLIPTEIVEVIFNFFHVNCTSTSDLSLKLLCLYDQFHRQEKEAVNRKEHL